MNMVSYKIKDKNGDGYCGIAVSAREAARLAILVPRAKYYTWFHPEDFFSATEYSGRVYAWTEERAQEAGRADPKKWIPQSSVTSGTMWLLDEEAERLRLNPVESIAHLDANGDSNSTESSTNTPDHVGGETRSSDASDRLLEKQSRDSVSSTDTIELASTLRVSTASESTVEGAVAPEDGVKNSKTAEKGVQDMSGESGAHTTAEVEQCCGRIDDS
ncbi:hypothetical protein SARC_06511 [Sphaeroforma arctica JP610]|uniref:Uncharacterized protein n=1 Tax=Sphaeroforma arctica JP610 TaxID=667725 RepID=A0A0L0FWZ8_9EUKA|nr:hypothetical protein SARC_06511 [Sphaeroforma arctica JP610]KNC81159.1 hypothetical protein SARC_06511 [Sphaeroforma arctica JP610]|eukprot:XP_014155061.1 hypothetical protein SARC_06511 [Sphaeroforma arctica JP610]